MTSAISLLPKVLFKNLKKHFHKIVILTSLLIIFILGPFLFYNIFFIGKIYPNILVAGVNIGGLSPGEAILLLNKNVNNNTSIPLTSPKKNYYINSQNISLNYNLSQSVNRAYNFTRTDNFLLDSFNRIKLLIAPLNIGLATTIDETKLRVQIFSISEEVSVKPLYPSIRIINESVEIEKGSAGTEIDLPLLRAEIGRSLSFGVTKNITIPVKVVDPSLNNNEALIAKIRAQNYLGKSLTLKLDDKVFEYKDNELINFLNPKEGFDNNYISSVAEKVSSQIERDPQNPKFEFNGAKVTEFLPAEDGITLNRQKFKDDLISNLVALEKSPEKNLAVNIPVSVTKPAVTTEKVNNLGIKELIGRGNSTYFHSIPGRVFNVNLAASRVNGTLVAPGETFSFDQTIGDVSKFTGYQQAYIIQNGRTVLGDGGGVCQVSTTLFRAILNAGLPVVERNAHAYRVGYYEQNSPPGIDATVYYPTVDFKFTNDTENYVLIEAKNDPKNYALSFEIYGTKDGRIANVTKPVISNYSPPLPDVYQDDPTLPIGTVKQTDFAAAGARVSFNYSVTKDGNEIFKKTFVSNYQPWAAVYLRGTKQL